MDVTRVQAYSPKVLDWRKLTAKDIIKYDSEGMEVPSVYLQWAKNFQVDLAKNDTDDTTYEMAVEHSNTAQEVKKQDEVMDSQSPILTTDSADSKETPQNSDGTQKSNQDLTPAQLKRKQMHDDKDNILKIAKEFRKDSSDTGGNAVSSTQSLKEIENISNNQIEALDADMQEVMSEIGEIGGQIAKTATGNGKENKIAEILKLQEELKTYGENAQQTISETDIGFDVLQGAIDKQAGIGPIAMDFGGEAIKAGFDVVRRIPIPFGFIGFATMATGGWAVEVGNKQNEKVSEATILNSSNQLGLNSYRTEIEAKTGVPPKQANSNEDTKNDETNTENQDTELKSSEDSIANNSDNPGSEEKISSKEPIKAPKKTENEVKEEKIASGSLDEILKRKIRKGEEV